MKPDAQAMINLSGRSEKAELTEWLTWASGFALFHFLVDLLIDILRKYMYIVDLKSRIKGLDGLAEV